MMSAGSSSTPKLYRIENYSGAGSNHPLPMTVATGGPGYSVSPTGAKFLPSETSPSLLPMPHYVASAAAAAAGGVAPGYHTSAYHAVSPGAHPKYMGVMHVSDVPANHVHQAEAATCQSPNSPIGHPTLALRPTLEYFAAAQGLGADSSGERGGDERSTEDMRESRLEKNRLAAKECRKKKKHYIACLERRVHQLEAQHCQLMDELKALRALYTTPNRPLTL